jgi:hypothetical protein
LAKIANLNSESKKKSKEADRLDRVLQMTGNCSGGDLLMSYKLLDKQVRVIIFTRFGVVALTTNK